MTKQEKDKIIKELRKKFIKEIQSELELLVAKTKQPKRWKPNYNDDYWTITDSGDTDCYYWRNDRIDNWSYLTGNCFKTEEEAEEHKKQIKYTARYKNYIEEHSEPIDWENFDQEKYYAEFNCQFNKIDVDSCCYLKAQGTICASSEQIIWDAIKEIGEDNFKKYVLEVK